MRVDGLESLILFVSDLAAAKAFYAGALGLPVLFEDGIIVVVGGQNGRVVLHRSDRGHDERGIFPAGSGVGGAAVRFTVDDPDAGERDARAKGLSVVWPVQEAVWGPVPGPGRSRWPLGGAREDAAGQDSRGLMTLRY